MVVGQHPASYGHSTMADLRQAVFTQYLSNQDPCPHTQKTY